jgi:hypothetical protein
MKSATPIFRGDVKKQKAWLELRIYKCKEGIWATKTALQRMIGYRESCMRKKLALFGKTQKTSQNPSMTKGLRAMIKDKYTKLERLESNLRYYEGIKI